LAFEKTPKKREMKMKKTITYFMKTEDKEQEGYQKELEKEFNQN
jgi:hypothetical protein